MVPAGLSLRCSVLLTVGDKGVKISNVWHLKLEAGDKQWRVKKSQLLQKVQEHHLSCIMMYALWYLGHYLLIVLCGNKDDSWKNWLSFYWLAWINLKDTGRNIYLSSVMLSVNWHVLFAFFCARKPQNCGLCVWLVVLKALTITPYSKVKTPQHCTVLFFSEISSRWTLLFISTSVLSHRRTRSDHSGCLPYASL